MRKTRFTDERIVAILGRRTAIDAGRRQAARHLRADDLHVAQAVRDVPGRRCPAPEAAEAENARLKKLVAERDLEIEVMKEINAKKW